MNKELLVSLLKSNDVDKMISIFDSYCLLKDLDKCIKELLPKNHAIYDKALRKDKVIKNEDGSVKDVVKVARLALPMQQKTVMTSAAFLGTPALEATPNGSVEENLLTIINKVLIDNKMDYKFKTIAKTTMSEKQCAELWYTQQSGEDYWNGYEMDSKFKLRVRLLSQSLGDKLYPVFDSYGDMVAFGRGYKIKNKTIEGTEKEVQHFDVYTAERFYFFKNEGSGWAGNYDNDKQLGIPNPIKKIPIIYYSQEFTEWECVQPLIDRLETIISNHADTNDYSGSPIVVGTGKVEGFAAEKGEQGKFLQVETGGKVEYLTFDGAPESIKMEIENLQKFINKFTNTVDTSFENMKGLGHFSIIALKMFFLDAHLKASDKEEIFGEGVQRRYNYIKHAISVLDPKYKPALKLDIKPKFTFFLPQNVEEEIGILVKAKEADIMSSSTIISLNPLVEDPDAEKEQMKKEAVEKAAQAKPPIIPPAKDQEN